MKKGRIFGSAFFMPGATKHYTCARSSITSVGPRHDAGAGNEEAAAPPEAQLQETKTQSPKAHEPPMGMLHDDDLVLVLSNAPDLLLAKRIAHVLVEENLAACVSLGAPTLSIYCWQGVVESVEEIPLAIKTTQGRQLALMEALARLHPHDVPEIIVVPVIGGTQTYIDWVRDQTRPNVSAPSIDNGSQS
jgi:periplasmic divalent cation tolerance protein